MKNFILLITILLVLFGKSASADPIKLRLAREYFRSNNYILASMYAEQTIMGKTASGDGLYDLTLIYIESKKELGELGHATNFLDNQRENIPKELSNLATAYLFNQNLNNSDFEKRLEKYSSIKKKDYLESNDLMGISKKKEIEELDRNESKKKPWLAATLSGIIPGAGQVYNGNYQSAAVSFLFNSLLLLSTIEFDRQGLDWPAVTSGFLFSMTYVGNIISSGRDAKTYNNSVNAPRNQLLKTQMLPELSFRIAF